MFIQPLELLDEKRADFADLCATFDHFYAFSDDHRVYKAGDLHWKKLVRAANEIPEPEAIAIYNAIVEKRMSSDVWDDYKWKRVPRM